MRISDWSSDVCSSDLCGIDRDARQAQRIIDAVGEPRRILEPIIASEAIEREQVRILEIDGARILVGQIEVGDVRRRNDRSEEHTSELQSLMRTSYAAFCLKTTPPRTAMTYRQHPKEHHTHMHSASTAL